MRYPHIGTGPHMDGRDARFRINTAPGVMEPKHGVNEAHGSFLQHATVIELRDELSNWLEANLTDEEILTRGKAQAWDECLDAIEANEINTEQARAGNPYRTPSTPNQQGAEQ